MKMHHALRFIFPSVFSGFIFISASAQINLPKGLFGINPTETNIGIGTATYPSNMLHIQAPFVKDSAERLLRTTVDDASADFFQVINGSPKNNAFSPVLWGHRESFDSLGIPGSSFTIRGSCNVKNDIPGSAAVMQFEASAFYYSGNLMGSQGSGIASMDPKTELYIGKRPLFDWKSMDKVEMRMMSNGTLGIGNTNPDISGKLDVGGDVIIGSPQKGSNRLLMHTRSWMGGDFFALAPSFPGSSSSFDFGNGIFIVPGKGVGIGTGNLVGNAKFAVAGKMYAEQIVVKLQANWPDTVFSPCYKQTPLQDLETFVKANHHLPGIPSENEVKAQGIDLGEMQKLSMQKIEEMSLYLIQLQKENEALKKRVELLEEKAVQEKNR
jgi:hypothetical protein